MHKFKQWYQDLNLQSRFTLVLLLIVSIPAIAIIFFFYGRAYDMVVSYTIRQEQDRSAETAPLIEESIQKVLDVSEEISSLDFYQTLFKNAITDSFTDLADSPDAASFSQKVSADHWYTCYQCQNLYGGVKRLSFRHKCTFK